MWRIILSSIIVFSITTTTRANIALTANDHFLTEPIELKKTEEIIIGISYHESSIEVKYDLSLSAFGGTLSSCDDIEEPNIAIVDYATGYLFKFSEQFEGLAIISLITNKPMMIDDYEVEPGTSIYQLVLFEPVESEYYIAFGLGFVAPVDPEPEIQPAPSMEMAAVESIGGGAMAMSSGPPRYRYFDNPWECPDLSNNNKVDLPDFALFSQNWLETAPGLKGDFNRDNDVDITDLAHFISYWLYDTDCPDIIYVKDNTPAGDDGQSWDTAYDELYTALSNSDSNSQIWVAEGTYYPDSSGLIDPRNAIFTLVEEAEVYGGFAGTENFLDQRNPFENETILSGDLSNNGLPDFANRTDNSYNVVASGVNAVLDGVTIQAGYNADIANGAGAGLYINSDMGVKNCCVKDNWANTFGGGVYIENSAVTLANCLVIDNISYNRAGVSAEYNSENESDELEIINVTICNNLAINNSGYLSGGGIYIYHNTNASIKNSIIWDNYLYYNSSYYYDDIVAVADPGDMPVVSYTDYYNADGIADGGNNIAVDPYFIDAANGDYHLESIIGRWDNVTSSWVTDNYHSFCVDAGDPADSIGFEPTPNGGTINMGYYGGTKYASKNEAVGNFQVTITPQDAINEGAIWRLYRKIDTTYYACDDSWHNSGETIEHLPTGNNYYIAVKDIEGYVPEPDSTYFSAIEAFILDASYAISAGSNSETVNYVAATYLYVSTDGNNDNTGNDPDAAYRTIQYAIDRSYGSVIYVNSVTYTENVDLDRVIRVEGYNGKPIITGGSGNCSTVSLTANAILKNFVITGGDGDNGGGMYIACGAATIRECDIRNNNAGIRGGGVYCQGTSSNVQFISCTIGTLGANSAYDWNIGGYSSSHHSAEMHFDNINTAPMFTNCSIRGGSDLYANPYCDWPTKIW